MEKKEATAQITFVESPRSPGEWPPQSPDTVQDLEKQKLPPSVVVAPEEDRRKSTDDWWLWEIGGILGCLLCLVGMIVFLKCYDNRPAPRWSLPVQNTGSSRFNVGLNAILSILSTAAKICVLIPISKGLSQLKWVWFSQEDRCLEDIETFENASKSFTGSMLLMWRLKFKHFATFAAFAMAVSVIWDPFIQNLIKYSVVEEPIAGKDYASDFDAKNAGKIHSEFELAQIPIALKIPDADIEFSKNNEADMFLKSYVYNSCFSTGYEWLTTEAMCSSGNCTWPPYISMGVKSKCADVTDRLNVTFYGTDPDGPPAVGPKFTATLPGGLNLTANPWDNATAHYNTFAITDDFEPLKYEEVPGVTIVKFQTILALDKDWKKPPPNMLWTPLPWYAVDEQSKFQALECVYVPVLQAWKVSTSAGSTNDESGHASGPALTGYKLLKEYEVAEMDPNGENKVVLKTPQNLELQDQLTEGELKTLINRDATFELEGTKVTTMNSWLVKHVAGRAEPKVTAGWNYTRDNGEQQDGFFLSLFFDILKDNWTARQDPNICNEGVSSLQCGFESMARGVSNSINSLAFLAGGAEGRDFVLVHGLTFVSKTWIRIQWFWLIIPSILWIMGVAVLATTIIRTRSAGIRTWRDNPLPMIFLDIDENERKEVRQHDMTDDGISKRAKALKLSLAVGKNDARMVKRASRMTFDGASSLASPTPMHSPRP